MSMSDRDRLVPSYGSRPKTDGTPRKGAKRMRRAIKNARYLISELFQREKFSIWLIYDQNTKASGEGAASAHTPGTTSGRPPPHPLRPQTVGQHPPGPSGPPSASSRVSRSESRGKPDLKGKGTSSPVPQEIERPDTNLDTTSCWSESEVLAEEKSVAASSRHKTALDTLSTMGSEEDWDEFEHESNVLKSFDDIAAMVQPKLFIGAFLAEQNRPELEKKGITHILQVGDNLTRSYEGSFQYRTISVSDTESANLLLHFQECFEFIDVARTTGGGVLVHCFAGISRSATVCIGYLMWKLNLSLGAAYSLVEGARACTQPNEGFQKQLEIFENQGGDLDLLAQWCSHHRNYDFQELADSAREIDSDDFDL